MDCFESQEKIIKDIYNIAYIWSKEGETDAQRIGKNQTQRPSYFSHEKLVYEYLKLKFLKQDDKAIQERLCTITTDTFALL